MRVVVVVMFNSSSAVQIISQARFHLKDFSNIVRLLLAAANIGGLTFLLLVANLVITK